MRVEADPALLIGIHTGAQVALTGQWRQPKPSTAAAAAAATVFEATAISVAAVPQPPTTRPRGAGAAIAGAAAGTAAVVPPGGLVTNELVAADISTIVIASEFCGCHLDGWDAGLPACFAACQAMAAPQPACLPGRVPSASPFPFACARPAPPRAVTGAAAGGAACPGTQRPKFTLAAVNATLFGAANTAAGPSVATTFNACSGGRSRFSAANSRLHAVTLPCNGSTHGVAWSFSSCERLHQGGCSAVGCSAAQQPSCKRAPGGAGMSASLSAGFPAPAGLFDDFNGYADAADQVLEATGVDMSRYRYRCALARAHRQLPAGAPGPVEQA